MPRKPLRADPANALPWPKDPPDGWPPDWPWPPEFPVGALGQKRCIENCLKQGGSLAACAIICAILDALPPMPPSGAGPAPPPDGARPSAPQAGNSVHDVLLAIDDDIIEELKQVAEHRANAVAELERAASQRSQGNVAEADALTRSAERENAKAHEIEIEIRGKERAKRKAQLFR